MKPTLYGFDSGGERRSMQPVPTQPTLCRACGSPLEPLRRYAGLCRACVMAIRRPVLKPTARIGTQLRVLEHGHRVQPDGRRVRYVLVECKCGRRRTLRWSRWKHDPPRCCNRCRLADIDLRGFEAEYAR